MARPRTNKSTIGNDPFAAVIPLQEPEPIEPPIAAPAATPVRRKRHPKAENLDRPVAPPPPAAEVPGRHKLTVHLEADLVERVKNAAYWNPRLTITWIAEQGIRTALEKVERDNGGRYPRRESELVGGRPIK